jgi:hypothetical protein
MKRLTMLFATLVMVFGFSAGAIAGNYGVWEDSAPGAVAGIYEWTSGELLGTPHDYVEVERNISYFQKVWYTFSMDDIIASPPAYKEVTFEASWLGSQDIFDDNFASYYSIDYLMPDGFSAEVQYEEWLDTDGDDEIDGVIAGFIIPEGCPEFEAVKIYNWTLGDGSEGNRWYVEYARMDTNCVPIPGAVWLLGSGLLGLIGIRRKK